MAVTTFDIDKKTAQKLEELKIHLGATSKAEVLRKALALLSIASSLEDSNGAITICKDGNDHKIILR